MRNFKYILLLLVFALNYTNAQQFSFQTTSLSVLKKVKNGEWGKWSKPKEAKMIVKLDYDKNKIIIYSSEIQHYSIIEYLQKQVSKVDEINSYLCKSLDGFPVKISFIVRKDKKNKTQLYIYNEDFVFCYDIVEIIQ